MPAVCSLDHPAVCLLPALPHRRRDTTVRDVGDVTPSLRREPNVVEVIAFVGAQVLFNGLRRRSWDGQRVQGRSKMDLVMVIGTRECYAQGDSLTIDDKVALGAELSAVSRVLACFIPPFTGAETVTLSSDCHFQSIPLWQSYSCKNNFQILEKIPALVHFWKWAWAADPEPYSRGNIFHWHPVRKTYRIPLKMTRWGEGGRPPLGERRSSGKRGWTLAQNSSGTSRQPGLRGNGFRDLEFRAMAGSSNKVVKIIHLH